MPMTFKMEQAIQCTMSGCACECFVPGKIRIRMCESCEHGWVVHALDKLAYRSAHQIGMPVEVVQPNIVFDIASLMLYGAQATPVRLKILLDRLFSVLQHDEVIQILLGFGWTYDDYSRGYILHDSTGRVLDKWTIASYEEEQLVLQQFLRFGETKAIAQELITRDTWEQGKVKTTTSTSRTESDIKKFIEKSNLGVQGFMKGYDAAQHFISRTFLYPHLAPTGIARLLTPALPSFVAPVLGTSIHSTIAAAGANGLVAHSPLRSLQTMEPFDCRKDGSTAGAKVGSSANEKTSPAKWDEKQSLLNLSFGTTAGGVSPRPKVKSDAADEKLLGGRVKHEPIESKHDTDGVLNYSLRDMRKTDEMRSPGSVESAPLSSSSPCNFINNKLKHMRKSTNPMKRPWQPTPGYGGTLISASGKKRVLCTACHKTFCDKGALKIHYSAVHLKEMHKCTVEGCNMMFSSRRSRNRHSANPNPKLHMPQTVRRKLMENISMSDEKADSPSSNMMSGIEPLGGGEDDPSSSPTMKSDDMMMQTPLSENQTHTLNLSTSAGTFFPTASSMIPVPSSNAPVFPLSNSLAIKFAKQSINLKEKCDEDRLSVDAELTIDISKDTEDKDMVDRYHDPSTLRNSRKRKSAAPIRCSQADDVMSDESCDVANDADEEDVDCTIKVLNDDEDSAEVELKDSRKDHEEDEAIEEKRVKVDDVDQSYIQNNRATGVITDSSDREMCSSPKHANHSTPEAHFDDNDRQKSSNSRQEVDKKCNNAASPKDDSTDRTAIEPNTNIDNEISSGSSCCSSGEEHGKNDSGVASLNVSTEDSDCHLKCPVCEKGFVDKTSFDSHYQSAHVHPCLIDGCSSVFSSKRSRNRHSANLNIHCRLLSPAETHAEMSNRSEDDDACSSSSRDHEDSLKDNHRLVASASTVHDTDDDLKSSAETASENFVLNLSKNPEKPADEPEVATIDCQFKQTDNDPENCEDGTDTLGQVVCHICQQSFKDNLALKEHLEKTHPKEMYQCTIDGCEKIFSTRKSRNRHSQNENLHRHLTAVSVKQNFPAKSCA